MIYLINRKYKSDTTDSMLFTPIVERVLELTEGKNIKVWSSSKESDITLNKHCPSLHLFFLSLRKINSDDKVFITSTPFTYSFAILCARSLKRFRLVYQVQDLYPDFLNYLNVGYKFLYRLLHPICFFLHSNIDLFFTISPQIQKQIISNYRVIPNKVIVVENWSDLTNVEFSYRKLSNQVVYLGNIGRAHDFRYILDHLSSPLSFIQMTVKTDTKSKDKLLKKISLLNQDRLKKVNQNLRWESRRLSLDEMPIFLMDFDYSAVALGDGFDQVLFPCKIYSSMALLMPIIFFGPEESYINKWISENGFGFHFSQIEKCYSNLNYYRSNIAKYNVKNPLISKLNLIVRSILD